MIDTDPAHAREILLAGGIVAVPTETVYGLAARVHDYHAVQRVFDVKGRPRSHPLIIHLGRHMEPSRWGVLNDVARCLATAFWPGPLTLLVQRTDLVPDWVTGGRETVALRVPDHPLTLDLLDTLDDGLVAPSANRFGRVSPTTAGHVEADLGDEVDLILDGGPCLFGIESTIVDCTVSPPQILRPGALDVLDIEAACGVRPTLPSGDSRAPGMLPSHYAPVAAVELCEDLDEAQKVIEAHQRLGRRAALVWREDVREYASRLYEDLRRADAQADIIVAVMPPDQGIGRAVRDRLTRAAHPR